MTNGPQAVSYFGKYPGYADFVQHAMPVKFLGRWRTWVGDYMHAGEELFGERWMDLYLQSPVWRFCLLEAADGASGKQAQWVGGFMPSMDSRGRYYPLLAAMCVQPVPPVRLLQSAKAWHDAMETRLVRCLEVPLLKPAALPHHFGGGLPGIDCVKDDVQAFVPWPGGPEVLLSLLDDWIAQTGTGISFWQAETVADGDGILCAFESLPEPASFARLQARTSGQPGQPVRGEEHP